MSHKSTNKLNPLPASSPKYIDFVAWSHFLMGGSYLVITSFLLNDQIRGLHQPEEVSQWYSLLALFVIVGCGLLVVAAFILMRQIVVLAKATSRSQLSQKLYLPAIIDILTMLVLVIFGIPASTLKSVYFVWAIFNIILTGWSVRWTKISQ